MPDTPPDALLFITPDCPHCPAVLRGLSELVKEGRVGRLTVVNAAVHPEQAAEYGVRAAPWLRLGPFTLTGAQGHAELRNWAERARTGGGAHYVEHLLRQGGYRQAAAFVTEDAMRLKDVLALVANTDIGIDVRLGASALLEAYANTPQLRALLPELAALVRHADHRVRADACHLLGLTGSDAARSWIESCLDDENGEVREIAEEAIQELRKGSGEA